MKNPSEVLRTKEQEMFKLKLEIEALRITARLLSDEGHSEMLAPKQQDVRQLIEMP